MSASRAAERVPCKTEEQAPEYAQRELDWLGGRPAASLEYCGAADYNYRVRWGSAGTAAVSQTVEPTSGAENLPEDDDDDGLRWDQRL